MIFTPALLEHLTKCLQSYHPSLVSIGMGTTISDDHCFTLVVERPGGPLREKIGFSVPQQSFAVLRRPEDQLNLVFQKARYCLNDNGVPSKEYQREVKIGNLIRRGTW